LPLSVWFLMCHTGCSSQLPEYCWVLHALPPTMGVIFGDGNNVSCFFREWNSLVIYGEPFHGNHSVLFLVLTILTKGCCWDLSCVWHSCGLALKSTTHQKAGRHQAMMLVLIVTLSKQYHFELRILLYCSETF
jgi:hypothetical protein